MYKTYVFGIIVFFFISLAACSEENKIITLYDEPLIDGMPISIKPHGEGDLCEIRNVSFTDKEKVTLEFTKKGVGDCCLVLFFRADEEFLVIYIDEKSDFTIHSSGVVLFGSKGYKTGAESKNGKVSYIVSTYVWNQYDLTGVKGQLYVFAVKGTVSPHAILPGEQNNQEQFQTSSNVVKVPFSF